MPHTTTVYTQDINLGHVIDIAGMECEVVDIKKLTNESILYDVYFTLKTPNSTFKHMNEWMELSLRYGIPLTVIQK